MRRIGIRPATAVLPLSMEHARKIEEGHRFRFPADYLEFLAYANLGVPIQQVFAVGRRERLIERFLGVHPNPRDDDSLGWYDIAVCWSQASERMVDDPDVVGMQLVPIAALFGGDLACMDFRADPNRPSVVVWEHEESEDCSPFVVPVAESFPDFLELLREFDEA